MSLQVERSFFSSPPSSSSSSDVAKSHFSGSRNGSVKAAFTAAESFRSLCADTTHPRTLSEPGIPYQTLTSRRRAYGHLTGIRCFPRRSRSGKIHVSRSCVCGEGSDVVTKGYRLSGFDEDVLFRYESHVMKRTIDVTTLGNLCVDIVLNVNVLPPSSTPEKLSYMKDLASSPPDEKFWEAGGNSNFSIAAARLGLRCAALGHVSNEKYGSFLREVLEEEGVQVIRYEEDDSREETLVCWVLVDPDHCHDFLSRFDFNKEPAFKSIKELPTSAKEVINQSKVLFCNGFLFDELSPEVIMSAVDYANESGCMVFFDPGPRGKSLFNGLCSQQLALNKLLKLSNVLLLTADEAEALTGIADPVFSAKALLEKGENTKWVIVKMGEKGCLMITTRGIYQVPAFKVDIKDTVGCGDSFAAAIALGYTRGLPVASTLTLANAVGAATAMGCGAGRNVATLNDVMGILLSSAVCDECDGDGTVYKFSMDDVIDVGIAGLVQRQSASSHSSWSMPFNTVTRKTAELLTARSENL